MHCINTLFIFGMPLFKVAFLSTNPNPDFTIKNSISHSIYGPTKFRFSNPNDPRAEMDRSVWRTDESGFGRYAVKRNVSRRFTYASLILPCVALFQ